MIRWPALAAAFVLAACHSDREAATVTPDQERQLNEAATALDAETANASATVPDGATPSDIGSAGNRP